MADIHVACSGWGMNRVSMSVTAKGKRWEILHSLWIGWTFTLGIFSWVAFFYIGIRARQRKWILWGVLYLVPIAVVILLLAADASAALGVPAMLLTFGLGVTSIFHAFWVRKEYLVRLARATTHSEAESMDEGGSGQDVSEQPSAPRDYVRTRESGN